MKELKAKEYKRFEDIKQIRPDGTEFWSARELAPALEYTKWENFHKVIKRAMLACENSGRSVEECFPEVRKTSNMPKGGTKSMVDYELTRYLSYNFHSPAYIVKTMISGGDFEAIYRGAGNRHRQLHH